LGLTMALPLALLLNIQRSAEPAGHKHYEDKKQIRLSFHLHLSQPMIPPRN
jgi:hypothetical protein